MSSGYELKWPDATDPSQAGMDPRVSRLADLGRELGAITIMFHSQVAEHLGLSVTDHKCLDLAVRGGGQLTAGRIAELSGLSTGAVTGVIDRLERAGFVRRVRDPLDRRKVVVEVTKRDWSEFSWIFSGLLERLRKVTANYTPDQLDTIAQYIEEMNDVLRAETVRLRDEKPPAKD